jgi:hypothetical protein
MSFFEPLPEPIRPERAPWSPPVWDRPSEGTLGAIVPVGEILCRNEHVVISLDAVRAYPNGFVIDCVILRNPDEAAREPFPPMRDPQLGFPRVGVRFANGQTAGRRAERPFVPQARDDDGIPTSPTTRPTGGGGAGSMYRFSTWVFPLPPPGPLEVFVALGDVLEGQATIDGGEIVAAAQRAQVIWS